ncbi:MAG: hypothetical protein ACQERB_03135 [Promethearchaeati archaeon]
MIYKIFLIDGDSGIAILDTTLKKFSKDEIEKEVLPNFFNEVNKIIDNIHGAMEKGRNLDEVIRIIEAESSTMVILYHFPSRILICSISDADDNIESIKKAMQKIGNKFWKKHKSEIENFRNDNDKTKFKTFDADIEIITIGGKIAEEYPQLIIIKNVLENIRSMGIINDLEYLVALKCDGRNSPLEISRKFEKTKMEIYEVLKKLEELEIIKR